MIKRFFVDRLPFLGKYKRFLVALKDAISPVRETYSQHQEDKFIFEYLKKFDTENAIYVDVGANHPSDISNTYLLYRHGHRGLIIEPNDELIGLFRKFRKRDDLLMIGCSDTATVSKFNVSKTPVISSFSDTRDVNVHRSMYVPILPLDAVIKEMNFTFITILSIDVEGLNFEVLKGSANTIKLALLLCIEYDKEEEKSAIQKFLGSEYELLATYGCNMVLLNRPLLAHLTNPIPLAEVI